VSPIIGSSTGMTWCGLAFTMLKYAVVLRSPQEVLGQLARILAAALLSRIWVPVGNTGRANVSAMRPMPIPDDLQRLLDAGARKKEV
jgi:hypothetical protein